MKAEEFLKMATEGTEAGEVIKENHLTEAIVKLLNNYADIRVKNCSIPDVSKQSELLKALYTKHEEETGYISMTQQLAEGYLKSLL